MSCAQALATSLCCRPGRPAGTPQQTHHRRPRAVPCRAGQGFGSSSSGGSGKGGGKPARDKMQDVVRESRETQLQASDMLAKILQAENPRAVAEQYVDSLTESFFYTANAYLSMARKEGNADVVGHIEGALRAALEAKQATLRPEIQLLNRLLQVESQEARQQMLFGEEETLLMNNKYFFGLLERMQSDVARQPDSPQKAALVQRLAGIHQDATAAVAGR